MTRPRGDSGYLQAAPGRWKYAAWAGFAAAGIAYLVVAGGLGLYLLSKYGPVTGILVFNVLLLMAVPLFRAGMNRAKRKSRNSDAGIEG
ncbi:MAG TPA: hypothetical protein VJB14_01020 [Planctomycetota bacterium]|nr:hypothetical protein [Planctomycetota bacterium]